MGNSGNGGSLRRIAAWIGAGACALASLSAPAPAHAQGREGGGDLPSEVRVALPACAPEIFAVEPFVSVLKVELWADGVERVNVSTEPLPKGEDTALSRVVIDASPCSASAEDLIVTVDDATTSKQVTRRFGITDLARPARPRAIALAVAELLHASWLELTLPASPPPDVPVPQPLRSAAERRFTFVPPESPSSAAPSTAPPLFTLGGTLTLRTFPSIPSALLGGRLALSLPLGPLRLRLDGGAGAGAAEDALGDVDFGWASGGIGILYSGQRGPVEAEIGPRFEGGVGWVTGTPLDRSTSSDRGSAFVFAAGVLGAVHVRLSATWRLTIELEAAHTITGLDARADGRQVTGLDGPLLGAGVGVSYAR